MPDYERHDATALRAQGHSDADLARPLGASVRRHPVNADGGQLERDDRKYEEKREVEAPAGDGVGDELVHGVFGFELATL